jgi:hypothetical protein
MLRKILPLACIAALPMAASALPMVGLTTDARLVYFDSANPGNILYTTSIFGLSQGERFVGLDKRPANGQLYALSNLGQIYVINQQLGIAGKVGAGGIVINQAANYGVNFNPVADRIRIIADDDSNQRANPDTGALVAADTTQSPTGDRTATAYDRSTNPPAALTTMYVIDTTSDTLGIQGGFDGTPSPNGGVITNIGPLGVNAVGDAGFDIGVDGSAVASFLVGTERALYNVSLVNGTSTRVGAFGAAFPVFDVSFVNAIPTAPQNIAVPTLNSIGFYGLLAGIAGLGAVMAFRRK